MAPAGTRPGPRRAKAAEWYIPGDDADGVPQSHRQRPRSTRALQLCKTRRGLDAIVTEAMVDAHDEDEQVSGRCSITGWGTCPPTGFGLRDGAGHGDRRRGRAGRGRASCDRGELAAAAASRRAADGRTTGDRDGGA